MDHKARAIKAVFTLVLALYLPLACMPEGSSDPPKPESLAQEMGVAAPVVQIIPAAEELAAAPAPDPLESAVRAGEFLISHYCVCFECCGKSPGHPAYGVTASGRPAEPYVSVAVDPDVIPLGSAVFVDYGGGDVREYRADDTGNFSGNHIDVCVAGHEEALELGVRRADVYWAAA